MAPSRDHAVLDGLSADIASQLGRIATALELDLEGTNGTGAWQLTAETLDQVTQQLENYSSFLVEIPNVLKIIRNGAWDRSAASSSRDIGDPHLQTRNLCHALLKCTAFTVRWQGDLAWPQSAQPQRGPKPGSAATSAGACCAPSGSGSSGDRPPDAPPQLLQSLRELSCTSMKTLHLLLTKGGLDLSRDIASTLLRMQTLQACSRSLAHATDSLTQIVPQAVQLQNLSSDPGPSFWGLDANGHGVAAAAGGGGGPRQAGAAVGPVKEVLVCLHHALDLSVVVLSGLISFAARSRVAGQDTEERGPGGSASAVGDGGTVDESGAGSSGRSAGAQHEAVAEQLWEALAGSALVEHAACALLHGMAAQGSLGHNTGTLACVSNLLSCYTLISRLLVDNEASSTAILGGPCASYLATAAGLQLLCTADGGPSYGMRSLMTEAEMRACWGASSKVQAFLEALGGGGGSGGGGGGSRPQRLNDAPLVALVQAINCRPASSQAALDLLRRVGYFIVAAAQVQREGVQGGGGHGTGRGGGGSGSGSGSDGASTSQPPWALDVSSALRLAGLVLMRHRARVAELPAAAAGRTAADTGGWRLTCAVVREAVQGATESCTLEAFARCLYIDTDVLVAEGVLPAEPPPALATALSCGLLPCLELLVRRAGHRPAGAPSSSATTPGSAAGILVLLLDRRGGDEYLASLLTYGDPTEAAAFITSMAKLLRVTAAQGFAGAVRAEVQPGTLDLVTFGHPVARALMHLRDWVRWGMMGLGAEAVEGGAGDGAWAGAGGQGVAAQGAGAAEDSGAAVAATVLRLYRGLLTRLAVSLAFVAAVSAMGEGAAGPADATAAQREGEPEEGVPLVGETTASGTAAGMRGHGEERRVGGAVMGVAAGEGAAAGEERRAVHQQARRAAVQAACEWLPSLSQVVVEAVRHLTWGGDGITSMPYGEILDCLDACVSWLPTGFGDAKAEEAVQDGDTDAAASAASGLAAAGASAASGAMGAGRRRLTRLWQAARVVELLGAGMVFLEAYVAAGCEATPGKARGFAQSTLVAWRLLAAALLLAVRAPGEVRRALACDPAEGFPAHCTWSSRVVGRLVRGVPDGGSMCGEVLVRMLEAWEQQQGEAAVPKAESGMGAVAVRAAAEGVDQLCLGVGLLDLLGEEAGRPCALRVCSWGRCTNLAGDSEAGVVLKGCSRCGEAWYCGRECQVAHWREGHKVECGG